MKGRGACEEEIKYGAQEMKFRRIIRKQMEIKWAIKMSSYSHSLHKVIHNKFFASRMGQGKAELEH